MLIFFTARQFFMPEIIRLKNKKAAKDGGFS